jgi:hypothetical protein
MKAQLIEALHTLTALHAPPGFEQPVVRHLRAAFAPLATRCRSPASVSSCAPAHLV